MRTTHAGGRLLQMMITIAKIIECIGGTLVPESYGFSDSDYIDNVITDTRLLSAGGDYSHTAFIAVKGEVFDGNDFIGSAAKAGVFLIVAGADVEKARRAVLNGGKTVIVCCEDTLKAYGRIAGLRRMMLDICVIGVTGSVGKTTAKEFVSKAVSSLGKTAKTPKNHNNEVGVPATILSIDSDAKYAVIEMGMRGRGQISFLAGVARPHVGIITNIGTAHLELLGSMENTRLAKLEIADFMGKNDFLLVNGDDELLAESWEVLDENGKQDIPGILTFGLNEGCYFRASNVSVDAKTTAFDLAIGGIPVTRVTLGVVGEHFIYAALAGIGAANIIGAGEADLLSKVIPAVSSVRPEDTGRQQIYELPGGTLIDDCYNASPEAVRAELGILSKLAAGGHKVAFLGDMLELGDVSEESHMGLGKICDEFGVDVVVCVGERALDIEKGAPKGTKTVFRCFENSKDAAEYANEFVRKGSTVLVKGSHAMKMGVISSKVKEIFENEN